MQKAISKWGTLLTLALSAATLPVISAEESPKRLPADPYGVCCHTTREERWDAPALYPLMKKAGVNLVRFDIDQLYLETKPGFFQPEYKELMLSPMKEGLDLLAIIGPVAPEWASKHWDKLDAYAKFVRQCAEEFRGKIKYYEVYNEANNGADWNPNAKQLAALLKVTYTEMKKVDPEVKILYNGLAGVPLDYFEESLEAGAGKYFDIMNIHPYCSQPESLKAMIEPLQEFMKERNLNQPIWITETGWTAGKTPFFYREVLPAAVKRLGMNPAECTIALFGEPKAGYDGCANFTAENFPGFKGVRHINSEELENLSIDEYPLLIASDHERILDTSIPALLKYVKMGGTLILPSGLPFYFEIKVDGKGGHQLIQVNDKHLKDFHIAWESWWTKKGVVPYQETYQRTAPGFEKDFNWPAKDHNKVGRFLTAYNLAAGDEFIPMVVGGDDKYQGVLAAIYSFNSDLKGNIIASTSTNIFGVTRDVQAMMLARTYINAFACGVERVFWYLFHDNLAQENFFESHFGMVDRQYKAKPAYNAYKTLTSMLPGGSTVPVIEEIGDLRLANWTRPDGKKVWAVWYGFSTADSAKKMNITIDGDVTEAVDFLGNKISIPEREINVTGGVQYFVGPEHISLEEFSE